MCSASPGAAGSRSSSRWPAGRTGCTAWSWWPPGRARSWCPGIRRCCCTCSRRGATGTRDTRPASPASCTGAACASSPALARELLHATARLAAARGYYYQLLSGLGWTSLPRLRKLRPPTLILAGDDDPIIPLVNARIMHRLIPDGKLHVYHGGHLELGLGAERLGPVVEAFLDAHPAVEGSQS